MKLKNIRQVLTKNGQLVTSGMFYCRDSAGFSVSVSNKLSCNLTVKCSEIGNKNIPPTVSGYITTDSAKQKIRIFADTKI